MIDHRGERDPVQLGPVAGPHGRFLLPHGGERQPHGAAHPARAVIRVQQGEFEQPLGLLGGPAAGVLRQGGLHGDVLRAVGITEQREAQPPAVPAVE